MCSVALRAKEELGPRIVRLLAPQARLAMSGVTVRTPGGHQTLAQVHLHPPCSFVSACCARRLGGTLALAAVLVRVQPSNLVPWAGMVFCVCWQGPPLMPWVTHEHL